MSHPHPGLASPPPLPADGLRVVALGGLGEIGRNMTVFEHAGKLLVVDCGVLFPEEHQPGVDVILPDFSSLRERIDDVVAVLLTHGHEDHIGGVPYLLRERGDIPVVGSRLTLALLTAKLKEHGIRPSTVQVTEGDTRKLGPFGCEFVAVNHSIPDGLAVAIRTKAGMVLHTGDFKMDQFPLDGRITDLRAFARLGRLRLQLIKVGLDRAGDGARSSPSGLEFVRRRPSLSVGVGLDGAAVDKGAFPPDEAGLDAPADHHLEDRA